MMSIEALRQAVEEARQRLRKEAKTLDLVTLREYLHDVSLVNKEPIDIDMSIQAILNGEIVPDDNDGLIPAWNKEQQYSFGLIITSGPWFTNKED